MSRQETEAVLRRAYAAYANMDIAEMDGLMADDFVMHVNGRHPLAGTYSGKPQAWEYLARVAQISGGRGGWEVHAVTSDDDGHGVALLTGTIRDFVRPVLHVWHVRDGRLVEFWDASHDQATEDAFWADAAS